jgi:integrase
MLRVTVSRPTIRRENLVHSNRRKVKSHLFRIGVRILRVLPGGHKSAGKGRNQAREASEISFHSLRHSAVTMLKAAGVSDFIAREIVGHESAAVSRQYTHLTTDDKRAAMQRLPDVTGFDCIG